VIKTFLFSHLERLGRSNVYSFFYNTSGSGSDQKQSHWILMMIWICGLRIIFPHFQPQEIWYF